MEKVESSNRNNQGSAEASPHRGWERHTMGGKTRNAIREWGP